MTRLNPEYMFVVFVILSVLSPTGQAKSSLSFPGPEPGKAKCKLTRNEIVLENKALSFACDISASRLISKYVRNGFSERILSLDHAECFQLFLDGGRTIKARDLEIIGRPQMTDIKSNPDSSRLAERIAGKQIAVTLVSYDENLEVRWRGVLRDGSNYIRQQTTLTAKNEALPLKEIVLWELPAANAEIKGISSRVSNRSYCAQQGLCQLNDKLSYALQALR